MKFLGFGSANGLYGPDAVAADSTNHRNAFNIDQIDARTVSKMQHAAHRHRALGEVPVEAVAVAPQKPRGGDQASEQDKNRKERSDTGH